MFYFIFLVRVRVRYDDHCLENLEALLICLSCNVHHSHNFNRHHMMDAAKNSKVKKAFTINNMKEYISLPLSLSGLKMNAYLDSLVSNLTDKWILRFEN